MRFKVKVRTKTNTLCYFLVDYFCVKGMALVYIKFYRDQYSYTVVSLGYHEITGGLKGRQI